MQNTSYIIKLVYYILVRDICIWRHDAYLISWEVTSWNILPRAFQCGCQWQCLLIVKVNLGLDITRKCFLHKILHSVLGCLRGVNREDRHPCEGVNANQKQRGGNVKKQIYESSFSRGSIRSWYLMTFLPFILFIAPAFLRCLVESTIHHSFTIARDRLQLPILLLSQFMICKGRWTMSESIHPSEI